MLSTAELYAPPPGLGLAVAFVWGALWGSFLNVVIHRVPRGLSIVRPGSHCPGCGHAVRGFDNVPILSWLVLRGRCRDCETPISPRYPLVEALGGLVSLAVYARFVAFEPAAAYFGNLAAFLVFFAFAAALIAVVFIDLDYQIIPNSITFGGMALGVLSSLLLADVTWWESLLGVALGGGVILTLSFGYRLLRGIHGMGGGDAKLLAMIGAFLGYRSLLFVLLVASVLGLALSLVLGLRRRLTGQATHLYDPASLQDEGDPEAPGEPPRPGEEAGADLPLHRTAIPFGPCLAVAALTHLLAGPELSEAYMDLVFWLAGGGL